MTTKAADVTNEARFQLDLLENATGIKRGLLNAVTDTFVFRKPTDQARAEVFSMLLLKECLAHDVQLAYVEPAVIASQICQMNEQEGFAPFPQFASRLLRKPLVAISGAKENTLSLRVQNENSYHEELFKIG